MDPHHGSDHINDEPVYNSNSNGHLDRAADGDDGDDYEDHSDELDYTTKMDTKKQQQQNSGTPVERTQTRGSGDEGSVDDSGKNNEIDGDISGEEREFDRHNQQARAYDDDDDHDDSGFDFDNEDMQPMLVGSAPQTSDKYEALAIFIRIVSSILIVLSIVYLISSAARLFEAILLKSSFAIVVTGITLGIHMFVAAVYIVGSCFGFQSTFDNSSIKDRLFKAKAYRATLIFYICVSVLVDLLSNAALVQVVHYWWAYVIGFIVSVLISLVCCLPCIYCAHGNVVEIQKLDAEAEMARGMGSHGLTGDDMI